jgi:hypothetical protein
VCPPVQEELGALTHRSTPYHLLNAFIHRSGPPTPTHLACPRPGLLAAPHTRRCCRCMSQRLAASSAAFACCRFVELLKMIVCPNPCLSCMRSSHARVRFGRPYRFYFLRARNISRKSECALLLRRLAFPCLALAFCALQLQVGAECCRRARSRSAAAAVGGLYMCTGVGKRE